MIVILGVLAAVAVPSFLDLRKDGWNARVASASGAFAGALQRAKALCMMTGTPGSATIDLAATGGALDFDANCYPMGTNWASGTPSHENCREVWQTLMRGLTARLETDVAQADVEAFQVGDQCAYRFLKADGSRVSNLNAYAAMVAYYYDGVSRLIYYRDLDDNVIVFAEAW